MAGPQPSLDPSQLHRTVSESEDEGTFEWSARIHVAENALSGSFSVLIFLGEVPGPGKWYDTPAYVGSVSAYVAGRGYGGSYGTGTGSSMIEGFVHLNSKIAKLSTFSSFHPRLIVPYLTENLHWRIEMANGDPISVEDVHSLEVIVCCTRYKLLPGEKIPKAVETKYYHNATTGRKGGWRG